MPKILDKTTMTTVFSLFATCVFIVSALGQDSSQQQKELPPENIIIEFHDVGKEGPIEWGFPQKCLQKRWPVWFYYWQKNSNPALDFSPLITESDHLKWSYQQVGRYSMNYPPLRNGDIFPLINSLYVYSKDGKKNNGMDAFRLNVNDYPSNVSLRGDTIIVPLSGSMTDRLVMKKYPNAIRLGRVRNFDITLNEIRNHQGKKGSYQIQLLINDIKSDKENDFAWYGVGDTLMSFMTTDYKDSPVKISMKIVSLVPPDVNNERTINGLKCRLIGWFELELVLELLEKGDR